MSKGALRIARDACVLCDEHLGVQASVDFAGRARRAIEVTRPSDVTSNPLASLVHVAGVGAAERLTEVASHVEERRRARDVSLHAFAIRKGVAKVVAGASVPEAASSLVGLDGTRQVLWKRVAAEIETPTRLIASIPGLAGKARTLDLEAGPEVRCIFHVAFVRRLAEPPYGDRARQRYAAVARPLEHLDTSRDVPIDAAPVDPHATREGAASRVAERAGFAQHPRQA
jgi:hypothetical protein